MKTLIATAAAVLLSACSGAPSITAGADPADPGAPVPPLRYSSVTAGTVDYRPVAARPWTERSQGVAPGGSGQ